MKNLLSMLVVMVVCFSASKADTPANCTFDDIRGVWTFYEGPRTGDKQISCTNPSFTNSFQIMLEFPNHAIDEDGNVGFWTIIYNQGFEAVVAGRKYFAFSYYVQDHTSVTSFCRTTFVSTSHDVGVNPKNWACFQANKTDSSQVNDKVRKISEGLLENRIFSTNKDLFERVNMKQSSWRAGVNAFHETATVGYMLKLAGGKNSIGIKRPKPANVTAEVEIESSKLPESFDWRNVNGVNYISPIRNQGECGSCYAFGSMALHEARIRVKSANKIQKVFSTQDIVECSPYSQGCDGGFPYLVAGKYAEDYGIVEEKCNPYKGFDGKCHTDPKCDRYYATNYTYIGGFYGACNEPLMRISLVNNGPIAISFEVYDDFFAYQSGIYHHTEEKDTINFKFNPWEITNHVVLIVGYGADAQTGEKYWIVKNSWGESWGESGYFRIRRGTDECSIESIAVEADIILKE